MKSRCAACGGRLLHDYEHEDDRCVACDRSAECAHGIAERHEYGRLPRGKRPGVRPDGIRQGMPRY